MTSSKALLMLKV